MEDGKLSVVATPIGNLEDMTLRGIRTLQEVDVILCEDTRVTSKLLNHYDIKTPLERYDAHTSDSTHEKILAQLRTGAHYALVSDAGTPGISDPGVRLVDRARGEGILIESIPGVSALTAAISIAGLRGNQFTFLGYIPQKKGRQTFFSQLSTYSHPVIFFESTHRIIKTLDSLAEVEPNSSLMVIKELTKIYERVISGTTVEVAEIFTNEPELQKGEFVIIFGN